MVKRIASSILKLIASTLLVFGAAGYAVSRSSGGAFDTVVMSRITSLGLLGAGVLCWVAAFVVRRWPAPREPEVDAPTTCPMCGEPLEPHAEICPNCFELRNADLR